MRQLPRIAPRRQPQPQQVPLTLLPGSISSTVVEGASRMPCLVAVQELHLSRGTGCGCHVRRGAAGILLLVSCCWHPAVGIPLLGSCCWYPSVGIPLLVSRCWDPAVGIPLGLTSPSRRQILSTKRGSADSLSTSASSGIRRDPVGPGGKQWDPVDIQRDLRTSSDDHSRPAAPAETYGWGGM